MLLQWVTMVLWPWDVNNTGLQARNSDVSTAVGFILLQLTVTVLRVINIAKTDGCLMRKYATDITIVKPKQKWIFRDLNS